MVSILFIHLLGLLSPGPDFFYVSRQAASNSTRNAVAAAIGISLGVGFWASVAIFGLALLHHTNNLIQYIIMCLGGIYLGYIGFKMLKIRKSPHIESVNKDIIDSNSSPLWKEILKGLMVNIFNAKAAVFFSSVISGLIGNLSRYQTMFLLLILFITTTFIYFTLIALLFSRPIVRKTYLKYNRFIDNFAGSVFILFGMKLLYEGLSAVIL